MPELPEVETIVRQLSPVLLGQRVVDHTVIDPKLKHLQDLQMTGAKIKGLNRVGKQIVFTFGDGPVNHLAIHLRMTGSLIWRMPELATDNRPKFDSADILIHHQPNQTKHHRWILNLEKGSIIFSDIRRFGTVVPCQRVDQLLKGATDPLSEDFTVNLLKDICSATSRPIKVLLLDQSKIVGIGNIYASEILFRSRISPARPASSIQFAEIGCLYAAIQEVLLSAIKHNGTTFSDYRDSKGEKGGFQNLLGVYNREGLGCANCDDPIQRIVQAQRSTFFCASCQT